VWQVPNLLDIIEVPVVKKKSEIYHPENYVICNTSWEKFGNFSYDDLEKIVDNPKSLWLIKDCYKDRIPLDYVKKSYGQINNSLLLIKPQNFKIKVKKVQYNDKRPKIKVRSKFEYKNINYNLTVTDPVIEYIYKKKGIGEYTVKSNNLYLGISLGVPYNGDCYKLVASVISEEYKEIRKKYQKAWASNKNIKIKADNFDKNKEETKNSRNQKRKKLINLTKKYKEKRRKINELKRRLNTETEELEEKIGKLEKEKEELESPFLDDISKYKSEIKDIKEELVKTNKGKKRKISTEHAELKFYESKSLKIKDKKKALKLLKNHGLLEKGVKLYKNPIRKLKNKGLVDDSIAYYAGKKRVSIRESMSFNSEEKELYHELRKLRNNIAKENKVPSYYIFNNRTLKLFAKNKPTTKNEMLKIKGVGEKKLKKYGKDFLEMINDNVNEEIIEDENKLDLNEEEKKLFFDLKEIRNKIASKKEIKYFKILQDKTLKLFAKEKPKTEAEMMKIEGVSEYAFNKYGKEFLRIIKNQSQGIREKFGRVDNYDEIELTKIKDLDDDIQSGERIRLRVRLLKLIDLDSGSNISKIGKIEDETGITDILFLKRDIDFDVPSNIRIIDGKVNQYNNTTSIIIDRETKIETISDSIVSVSSPVELETLCTGDRNINIVAQVKHIEKAPAIDSLFYYFTISADNYDIQGRDWCGFIEELDIKKGDTISIKGGHIKKYDYTDNYPSLHVNDEDLIEVINRSRSENKKKSKRRITKAKTTVNEKDRISRLVREHMNRP